MRPIVTTFCLLAAPTATGLAQGSPIRSYRASWADIAAVTVSGTTALLPVLLNLPKGAPSCAPCPASDLPGIDRWVVGTDSRLARGGSNVLLLGVGGFVTYAAVHDRSASEARGNIAMLANSISWTSAATQWLKVAVHRKRPVLYTAAAVGAATAPSNQQSLPSGHTSVAFAVATSYLVMANREHLPHRTRNTILLYGGATSIGALRVAGGSHFPTDVLTGAALGAGIGWLVAAVHPKVP